MRRNMKKNKGFTLVELIVVLVILAILAAILVPALLGWIDRAKQQQGVRRMHDIQVAAASALAEFHAVYRSSPNNKLTLREYDSPSGGKIVAYNVTNHTFGQVQKSNTTTNANKNEASITLVKIMLKYLDSGYGDKTKTYAFAKQTEGTWGMTASAVAAKGAEGLILLFDDNCKVVLLQYSDLNGFLYTWEAKTQKITVVENGKFIVQGKTYTPPK